MYGRQENLPAKIWVRDKLIAEKAVHIPTVQLPKLLEPLFQMHRNATAAEIPTLLIELERSTGVHKDRIAEYFHKRNVEEDTAQKPEKLKWLRKGLFGKDLYRYVQEDISINGETKVDPWKAYLEAPEVDVPAGDGAYVGANRTSLGMIRAMRSRNPLPFTEQQLLEMSRLTGLNIQAILKADSQSAGVNRCAPQPSLLLRKRVRGFGCNQYVKQVNIPEQPKDRIGQKLIQRVEDLVKMLNFITSNADSGSVFTPKTLEMLENRTIEDLGKMVVPPFYDLDVPWHLIPSSPSAQQHSFLELQAAYRLELAKMPKSTDSQKGSRKLKSDDEPTMLTLKDGEKFEIQLDKKNEITVKKAKKEEEERHRNAIMKAMDKVEAHWDDKKKQYALAGAFGQAIGKYLGEEIIGNPQKKLEQVFGQSVVKDTFKWMRTAQGPLQALGNLYGPLGGALSVVYGLLDILEEPTPNPVMEMLKEMREDMRKGFNEIRNKLDDLQIQVAAALAKTMQAIERQTAIMQDFIEEEWFRTQISSPLSIISSRMDTVLHHSNDWLAREEFEYAVKQYDPWGIAKRISEEYRDRMVALTKRSHFDPAVFGEKSAKLLMAHWQAGLMFIATWKDNEAIRTGEGYQELKGTLDMDYKQMLLTDTLMRQIITDMHLLDAKDATIQEIYFFCKV
ncbi:unnamed protein product, partial [Mesorhabditis spiculigera]